MVTHKVKMRPWLYTGIVALALSGFYSIFLVLLRTPLINKYFDPSIFKTSLVIHVDLSVLVWILSVLAAFWSVSIKDKHHYFVKTSNYVAILGVVLVAMSPFAGESQPILNNYIPMLENWLFVVGLALFASAILIMSFLTIICYQDTIIYYANLSSALLVILAYICFFISYKQVYQLQYPLDLHFFYETLFWSGGHVLQFIYMSGVMFASLLLIANRCNKTLRDKNIYAAILLMNLILALPALYPHFVYKIDQVEFTEFYTWQMRYLLSIPAIIMFVLLVIDLFINTKSSPWINDNSNVYVRPAYHCLLNSLILFTIGGMIGFMISGINVTIPAHYHGSIVGISIAFMGVSYLILHDKDLEWPTIAILQPYFYGIGQLMHISGLAWSGGYGALRKTPGTDLPMQAKIGMGLMGAGGLIAIIGGLIFVYLCAKRIAIIHSLGKKLHDTK